MARKFESNGPVRFAVVGLGHFVHTAILPAFASVKHAKLAALFSDDAVKLEALQRRYRVEDGFPCERFDGYLESGAVDAIYIALPNDLHCEYTVRVADLAGRPHRRIADG